MRPVSGFTLLEVMVALAIFSTAALSILAYASRITEQQVRLEDRTLALWVAENALAELRIQQPWPHSGYREHWVENTSRRWKVDVTVEDTAHVRLRRILVEVSKESDPTPLISLTGYRGER